MQIWTLKCSLNSLTLQFCMYDVFALPTPVLNLATFMYKHLLGALCFINIKSSSNYLPLKIWTLKICNHDISKTITARSFKLGQLIEDDE